MLTREGLNEGETKKIEQLAEKRLGMTRDAILKTPMWKLIQELESHQIIRKSPEKQSAPIPKQPASREHKTSKTPTESRPQQQSSYPVVASHSSAQSHLLEGIKHIKDMKTPDIKDDDIGFIVNLFAEYRHLKHQLSKEHKGLELLQDDPDFGPSDFAVTREETLGNTVKLEEMRVQILAAISSYEAFAKRRHEKEQLLAQSGQLSATILERWKRLSSIRKRNLGMFYKQFVPYLKR